MSDLGQLGHACHWCVHLAVRKLCAIEPTSLRTAANAAVHIPVLGASLNPARPSAFHLASKTKLQHGIIQMQIGSLYAYAGCVVAS
jgi:hypothetical protein